MTSYCKNYKEASGGKRHNKMKTINTYMSNDPFAQDFSRHKVCPKSEAVKMFLFLISETTVGLSLLLCIIGELFLIKI